MIEKKSVRSGFCSGSDGLFCALESTKCAESDYTNNGTYTFSSSYEIAETPVAHGGNCFKYRTLAEYQLGRCLGGPCAPNAESCGNTNFFGKDDAQSCTVENTLYGKCGDRCSWSPNDCRSGEFWSFPADDCNCGFVRVGACIETLGDHTSVTCAVSPDGCATSSEWISAIDVPFEHKVECTLCRKSSSQSEESVLEEKEKSFAGTEIDMLSNVNESVDKSVDESDQQVNELLLGGLVGGCVVALVLLSLSLLAYRRSRAT